MMSESSETDGVAWPTTTTMTARPVIVYENERRWIGGGGYSKKGLVPTERGPYSTQDGSLSWKTLEEASAFLLEKGWAYEENTSKATPETTTTTTDNTKGNNDETRPNNEEFAGFVVDKTDDAGDDVDEEGWSYASDWNHYCTSTSTTSSFNNSSNRGSKTAQALHFVRRRRLCRTKTFDASRFTKLPKAVYSKCDFCDSKAVDLLSSKLLESLAVASLTKQRSGKIHGNATLLDATVFPLKQNLVEKLGVATATKAMPSHHNSGAVSPTPMDRVMGELEQFAQKKNMLAMAASSMSMFNQSSRDEQEYRQDLADRKKEITDRYFGKEERDTLAALEIRYLDYPDFDMHCKLEGCADQCERYYPMTCPHEGCNQIMSRKYLTQHKDELCEFEIVECPKKCGDSVPKNRVDVHLRDACSLRDAVCPFSSMGCMAAVMAKDIPTHLENDMHSHLLLAANRMIEYQNVIRNLHGRLEKLELENQALRQQVASNHEHLTKDMSNFSNKVGDLAKKVDSVASHSTAEFKKLKTKMDQNRSHVK